MELQLEPSKGSHLPRHWCGVGHQPHHQLLPSLIHILHLSKSSRSAASRPGPYPATLDWTRPLKLFPHRCSRDSTDGGMPANSGFLGQEGPPSCLDLLALSSNVSHARTVPGKAGSQGDSSALGNLQNHTARTRHSGLSWRWVSKGGSWNT